MASHDEYNTYWGETHDNTLQTPQDPAAAFESAISRAAAHLDFYAAAYYTTCASAFQEGGHPAEHAADAGSSIILEGWKPREQLEAEWAVLQDVTRRWNKPGEFVTFPGYEWQGDGTSGDHNVFHFAEGEPLVVVDTVSQLYTRLRGRRAFAIPHHTAYRPGVRGRDWSVLDETITPFTEIFSIHGCSETDEEWVGMRSNPHMGPPIGPGTWQAALDRGLHLGAVGSTDNWGAMPGHYGHGLMACMAHELTRASLWEAFAARRVYAVTGDRIRLDFTVNGAPMGSVIDAKGPRAVRIRAVGADAIDRIELLRNGRVIATHCHQGTWDLPRPGATAKFKLRIEAGWGPSPSELSVPDRLWHGHLAVDGGRILGFDPCFVSPQTGRPEISRDEAAFELLSSQHTRLERSQNAYVFEFEASPESRLLLRMNSLEETGPVLDFARSSREMWFRDECVRMLDERAGIAPGSPERGDIYHHVAFKAKVHRVIPEAGYTAEFSFTDDEPLTTETHYRVRVEERNGQRAWSSPIWLRP